MRKYVTQNQQKACNAALRKNFNMNEKYTYQTELAKEERPIIKFMQGSF